jgi:DNA-nicking Smr family endonuclease
MNPDDDPGTADGETPFVVPIEDSLDLHTFAPRDVSAVVEEYLFQCHRKGFQEVRIIHGRGQGVQRDRVRAERSPWVVGFKDAPLEAGGWGATQVQLVIQ